MLPVQASKWEELQSGSLTQVLYGELRNKHHPGLLILTKMCGEIGGNATPHDVDQQSSLEPPKPFLRLCLFKLSMPSIDNFEAILQINKPRVAQPAKVGFFAAYKLDDKQDLAYRYSEVPENAFVGSHHMSLDYRGDHTRLVEFGVYCETASIDVQPLLLLSIESLVISPINRQAGCDFALYDVHTTERGKGQDAETRLVWQWQGSRNKWPDWLPWSKTTGPFSHFRVFVEGQEIGRSYCLEFPIHAQDTELSEVHDGSIEVRISGVLFGGEETRSLPVMIAKSNMVSQVESSMFRPMRMMDVFSGREE